MPYRGGPLWCPPPTATTQRGWPCPGVTGCPQGTDPHASPESRSGGCFGSNSLTARQGGASNTVPYGAPSPRVSCGAGVEARVAAGSLLSGAVVAAAPVTLIEAQPEVRVRLDAAPPQSPRWVRPSAQSKDDPEGSAAQQLTQATADLSLRRREARAGSH